MWADSVVSFSEQQLVDCTLVPNLGCLGGDQRHAYKYIKENGIASFEEYPYIDKMQECSYD